MRLGTPLYAYDAARLAADVRGVERAFRGAAWTRLYSLKANALPGLVRRIADLGFGASAVSRGELTLARAAGIPPEATALEGIGKTEEDLAEAVALAGDGRPLLWVSVESADEAASLADLAARRLPSGVRLDVLIRVNPGVDPDTLPGLAVGRSGSKFGVAPQDLGRVVRAGGGRGGPLAWRGLHVHAGSQLRSVDAWRSAVEAALAAFAAFAEHATGHQGFDTLDVGGGFPAGLPGAPPPAAFGAVAREAVRRVPARVRPARLAIEPGRALVAAAGWLVARVLHVRTRDLAGRPDATERQIVLDAGMTELIRPALYGAREHPILALTSLGRPASASGGPAADPADLPSEVLVEGPVCESTDRFGSAVLPPLERGDLVAIGSAGAYASAMFSAYNGRPRPAEVLLDEEGRTELLRRRGSVGPLP